MDDNPIVAMIMRFKEEMKAQIPTQVRFGKVVSENPLRIEVNGSIFDREDFLKSNIIQYFYLNETLLLMPIEEEQRYIIVAKVVDA